MKRFLAAAIVFTLAGVAAAQITEEESNRLSDIVLNSPSRSERVGAASGLLAYYHVPESKEGLQVARQWQAAPNEFHRAWGSLFLGMLDLVGIRDDHTKSDLLKLARTRQGLEGDQAVNALSMLGDDDLIDPLMEIFRTHPGLSVRERVACIVCHTGLFSKKARYRSLPLFLNVLKSPDQERQVKTWAGQAMAEITHQSLGLDANAWEAWLKKQPPL